MESKSYLDKPTSGYTQKTIEVEVPDVYSGVMDFEFSHLIGKKGKAVIAALLGTVVEWYDYALYGYMAAVLASRFFPDADPSVSLIKHFLVFALGFIAKPVGAYIFGSIGDVYGRKYALRWSILGIALPTVLIGCLPSYEQLGILSVWLLCACRIIQGIFISAEGDGVDIFIYESMPKKYACLMNSLTWISSNLGMSLASLAAGVCLLPKFPSWSWRVPFLLAGILGVGTVWFRKYLSESQDYIIYSVNKKTIPRGGVLSYLSLIYKNKLSILLAFLIMGAGGGTNCFYFVFWNNYLSKVLNVLSVSEACFKTSFLIILSTIIAPICGYLADRIGVIKSVKVGLLLCFMMMVVNGGVLYYYKTAPTVLMIATAVTITFLHISIYVIVHKLFNIAIRYRCRSISHAFGSMVFSSTSPAIAVLFWQKFQHPVAPLFYCCSLLLMGFIATLFVKNNQEVAEVLPSSDLNSENDSDLIGRSAFSCKQN